MSYPTVAGLAVEGTPYREAQVCLGPTWANSYYLFSLSGGNTLTNIYTNGTLTTPFANTGRATADAYGRFPPIYLDPSVIYRVRFFNSAGVQQWQQDPYTSQLATVGTSSLSAYGFQIAPTGEFTLDAPNTGGTGVTLTTNAGVLGTAALRVIGTLAGNSAIIINSSATTGAQTATFAATNKPGTATSSPAGWLPITCDGVQYYTPIWHGNNFTPYTPNPTAVGEIIVASSVTFGGNGLTTVVSGTATPGNWFAPTTVGIGAGYYINITKTSGLSGVQFSAANGSYANITSGGLTITSNAQATITGTYTLSSSVSGSPIVATGSITLSNNNGVQEPTYNGATPVVFAGNGTATINGVASSNWYLPTTASIGASYYLLITQTGGTSGYTFSAATGTPALISSGGISIGINGSGAPTNFVTGTYQISSDSAGTVVLGSGTITVNGSPVQSPNWSGTTPLNLAGNGAATLNGASTSSWYSPNASNVGSGFWIDITRTGGTSGVNFSAAQGSFTNITNSGITIGMSGTSGNVGTASVNGTYQISNSSSGTPVLGSGTVSLSVSGLTVIHLYTSAVTGATETAPSGTSNVYIEVWGGYGGGGGGSNLSTDPGGGGSGATGAYSSSTYACTGGKTLTYTVGAGGTGGAAGTGGANGSNGTSGGNSSVSSGTLAITTMTANAGTFGFAGSFGTGGSGGSGQTASGGNITNDSGFGGNSGGATGAPGAVTSVNPGVYSTAPVATNAGGTGSATSPTAGKNGSAGAVSFRYS